MWLTPKERFNEWVSRIYGAGVQNRYSGHPNTNKIEINGVDI